MVERVMILDAVLGDRRRWWLRPESVQSNRRKGHRLFNYLVPSESADEKMVSLNFTSWNQIARWLRRLDALRTAA